MTKTVFRSIQCIIVLGLAVYLAEKWVSGKLSYYINLRFAIFTMVGILGLTLMVLAGLYPIMRERLGHHTHSSDSTQPTDIPETALLILAIPLILGVFVPVRPLSASALSTRGIGLSSPVSVGQKASNNTDVAPEKRTVLDWIKIFNYEQDVSAYIGNPSDVIGFVYHDPRLGTNQFMVGRFAITCCVADAFAIGMAVDWPDSVKLVDNSWVEVAGSIDETTIDGKVVPMIHAKTVTAIQAPDQPYVYP